MHNDLFESISQRCGEEETPENRRILEIANELCGCCKLYEKQLRESKKDVDSFYIEQRVVEQFAKENNLWIPITQIGGLGIPGPCGNENDTYVSNDVIYKVNNLMNSHTISTLFEKIICHNNLFYETAYSFYAFTGFDGRTIMPIFRQSLIKDATPATIIEIETYMAALGFEKTEKVGSFVNEKYKVWDLLPRNVLKDEEVDLFIVDAEIENINS